MRFEGDTWCWRTARTSSAAFDFKNDMQKREIEKVGTSELLYAIVQLAKGSWAFAGLAGFCLTFLAIKEGAIEFLDQTLLIALIAGCVAFLVYQHWWTTKKAIPDL